MRTLTMGSIGIKGYMVRYTGEDDAIVDLMQRLYCAMWDEPPCSREEYIAKVVADSPYWALDGSSSTALLDSMLLYPDIAVVCEHGAPLAEGEVEAREESERLESLNRVLYPGWVGEASVVAEYLAAVDAEMKDGAYLTRGGSVVFGMGGDEVVIPGDTRVHIMKDGQRKWERLADGISEFTKGRKGVGTRVCVIA